MGAPGFWDDQASAARISTEHARVTRKLERYERLRREFDDAKELFALEPDLQGEVAEQLAPVEADLARLQEDALFTGEYDAANAILSIHAGAGGTESQDWVSMLLRMYLRWAEGHGFKTEIVDVSPGEEAGIKSVTVILDGPYAYGFLREERGVHRLVRLSPFDAAHRRHTSFALLDLEPS